jgi:hypothetical protein
MTWLSGETSLTSSISCFPYGRRAIPDLITHIHPPPNLSQHSPNISTRTLSFLFLHDFFCQLERPGFRVARRRDRLSRIGAPHRVGSKDAQSWFVEKFTGTLLGKDGKAL